MSKLLEELENYGVDINITLARFIEDEEFYIECLDTFKKEDNFEMLKKALDKKDYEDAFNIAHTIKGVVANLGITKLYDIVFKLVESLRSKDYTSVEKQYEESLKEYNNFLKILNNNI